jgi:hypothetical protein
VPNYDGRAPAATTAGDAVLWIPRVALSPLYFTSEYVLRRPLAVVVPAAERADLPRKVYDFFIFGADHKAGVVPVGLVEFGFKPSVGVYAFWDDAGFKGHDLALHVEAWPTDWIGGSLTERFRLDSETTLQLAVSGVERPDRVFYGEGPRSLQSSESRYHQGKLDVGAGLDWRFWRSSHVQSGAGMRVVGLGPGHYGDDPSLEKEAATGAFTIPFGFDRGYTEEYNRVLLTIDTRPPKSTTGSGVRIELQTEEGNDVSRSPAAGWLRYGAMAEGLLDLNGHGRVLSLSITALFADPLGTEPIPFTELVNLGGDGPMPGYFLGRLVDRSAAIATARYTWPIGPWLGGMLEADVGNVFGEHLENFAPGLLRFSGAIGLSLLGLKDVPVELLIGCGSETFDHGGQVDSVRAMAGVPLSF